MVIGRMSENNSLYREDLATYSKEDVFNHSLAEGFIYMWGMSNKIWAELNSKSKEKDLVAGADASTSGKDDTETKKSTES